MEGEIYENWPFDRHGTPKTQCFPPVCQTSIYTGQDALTFRSIVFVLKCVLILEGNIEPQ